MGTGFPVPREDDHEDVHWALTTAQSLHSQGDNVEALRWVRKAVAAAVASDLDGRAIELGRVAAELEDSFGVATTQRGDRARKRAEAAIEEPTMRSLAKRDFGDHPVDDLDSPTFVDSHRPGSVPAGSVPAVSVPAVSVPAGSVPAVSVPAVSVPTGSVPTGGARAGSVPRGSGPVDPLGAVDSEPTISPYTKHSAGAEAHPNTQTMTSADAQAMASAVDTGGAYAAPSAAAAPASDADHSRSAEFSNHDTFTMPAMTLEDIQRQEPSPTSTLELDDENLTMMSSPEPSRPRPAEDRTMPAHGDATIARWRVALLAASDGDARVMVLRRGDQPPEGAALAMIIPASAADAQALSALFDDEG